MSSRKIAVVLGSVIWLSVSAAPAARADDGGLLGDTAEVVGGAAQVADHVVQAVQSTAPQPLPQPEGPVVPPLAPVTTEVVDQVAAVEREAEQAVAATVRDAEQAVQPVVRVVESAGRRADEPAAQAVEPTASRTHTPA